LALQDMLNGRKGPISYGPCQFPTLGFIVERHQKIRDFVPEKFWLIELYAPPVEKGEPIKFNWSRNRIFDRQVCLILYEKCQEHEEATINSVVKKPKTKMRPIPLNTVEA
jgi:DNA topoisomerase III